MSTAQGRWQPALVPMAARRLAETAAREAGVSLALWLSRAVRTVSAAESAAAAPRPIPSAAQKVLAVLAETLAREEVPPLEEGRSYLRLTTEFGLSADEIAAVVQMPRDHVARRLRLVGLPDNVCQLIERRVLSVEHAYALIEAKDPASLAQAVQALGRAVETTRGERGR